MDDENPTTLADAWIAFTHTKSGTQEYEDMFWACDRVFWLASEAPEAAFELILVILAKDSSPRILENLSAGPLESLLAEHGDRIFNRVKEEASRNPLFRKLLGGVWQNRMSEELWTKIQNLWDRRGWDGIPDEQKG
ncbi:MAG: hypothetical protein JNN01_16830 [Opitutaceae bacterium]|nr:hypothetical protein [Opitutaceae bacterium]